MKRSAMVGILTLLLLVALSTFATADGFVWWKLVPPVITSPAANTDYATYQSIDYCWTLADGVPLGEVDHFELKYANSPPYAIAVYNPPIECGWDFIREVYGYCYTTDHQMDHEPIYWAVRTVYKDGSKSNWAVGYHNVGDVAANVHAPKITYPPIMLYNCNELVYHEWLPVPGAASYEYGWAHSIPNSVALFDDCGFQAGTYSPTPLTWIKVKHDCFHLPIYFLVRAVFPDGSKTNWAIAYYNMRYNCLSTCGGPVGVESSTWGKIKGFYR